MGFRVLCLGLVFAGGINSLKVAGMTPRACGCVRRVRPSFGLIICCTCT